MRDGPYGVLGGLGYNLDHSIEFLFLFDFLWFKLKILGMKKCMVVWGQDIAQISLLWLVLWRNKWGDLVLHKPWDTGLLARFGITSCFLSTIGIFFAW